METRMSNSSSSSCLSMVESRLPAGFRFYPRDDELICDYLMNKFATASDHNNNCSAASLIQNYNYSSAFLIDVDLNKCEPWDLPEVACVGGKEWYFYSQRDRKYATGLRTNRATISGYWKATGKDRPVFRMGRHLVGMRKTLVFYTGRAPKGRKTNWVMHEFRMEGPFGPLNISSSKDDWVLCRVFHKTSEQQSTIKPNLNSPRAGTVAAHHQTSSGCAAHSHNNCSLDYGSSSSLPPLMDTHIIFDQIDSSIHNNHKTAVTTNDYNDDVNDMEYNDDYNDNKDDIMYNNSQHVPCLSIFSPNLVNQAAAAATFSGQLFSTNLTGGNNNDATNNNVMIGSNSNAAANNFHPNLVSYNDCSQTNIIPACWSSQQLSVQTDGEILRVEAIKNT